MQAIFLAKIWQFHLKIAKLFAPDGALTLIYIAGLNVEMHKISSLAWVFCW